MAAPEQIIRECAERYGLQSKLDLRIGDFNRMRWEPASFDMVVGKAFLHHLTHEEEDGFLARFAELLKPDGIARFVGPCTNSGILTDLQFLIPVPGRPSKLNKQAFAAWKARDPHPDRDNSSRHYEQAGRRHFSEVEIIPFGGLQRFHWLLPSGQINRRFRRAALSLEERVMPCPCAAILPARRR